MAAATKQRQHPKIDNQETAGTPEEAGVKEMDTGAEEQSVSDAGDS